MNDVLIGTPFGGAYASTLGTPLPTDATSKLDVGFQELGLISDAGYADSDQRTFQDARYYTDSGDSFPYIKERTEAFQLTLIETTPLVLRQVYGDDNVTEQDGQIAVAHRIRGLGVQHSYVFDTITGNRVRRQVIPRGIITELGEIESSSKAVIGYDITIRAVADSTGATAYTYIATLTD